MTITRSTTGALDTVMSSTGFGIKFLDTDNDLLVDQISTLGTTKVRKVDLAYQSLLTTGTVTDAGGDDHLAQGSVWAKTLLTVSAPIHQHDGPVWGAPLPGAGQ